MGSLNKVSLLGNIGKDPETRYTAEGEAVCNFSIATSESWKNKAGEKQEKTEWHRLSFWGKLGEVAQEYLRKGNPVYVEGSIRSREYTDKEGIKRFAYEIRGDKLVLLGSKSDREESGDPKPMNAPSPRPKAAAPAAQQQSFRQNDDDAGGIDDGDVPF